RVREELRESEARFKQIADAIDDVFTITEVENNSIIYASPAYEQIWDRSLQDLYEDGEQWDLSIHPEHRPVMQAAYKDMVKEGKKYDEEYQVLRADGSVRWIRDRGYPIRDESGTVYRIAGVAQDITQRVQAEQALQASEANLRATLNSIGDAVIATDIEGDIISMNPVAEQLTGWKVAEAQGKSLTKIFTIVNSKTIKKVADPVGKVLESGQIVGLSNDTMLISKDGTEFQIADSAAPIHDDDGTVTGVVLVFRDVTAEYRVREELQESEARFQQISEVIEDVFQISELKT
ncbi:MAG: PAS domain S-box protein, partial [Anaerolineae bacterium]|nr:PAS domain S-box protein [Anaerolineae bacterium]